MTPEQMSERPAKPNPFYLKASQFQPVDRRHFLGLLALTCGWTMVSAAETEKKGKGGKGKGGAGDDQSRARGPSFQGEYVLPEALAEFSRLSVVLGRASDKTVTLSLLAAEAMEAVIELGTTPGKYARKIGPLTLPKGEPVEVVVDKLTQYGILLPAPIPLSKGQRGSVHRPTGVPLCHAARAGLVLCLHNSRRLPPGTPAEQPS